MDSPYIRFFPRDWQADANLRQCSLETRGLWIELLCLMAQSPRPGYLETTSGPISKETLKRLVSASLSELNRSINQLEKFGVISKNEAGIYYCRRMVKDAIFRQKQREFGMKGGNPTLKATLNPTLKAGVDQTLIPIPIPIPITKEEYIPELADRSAVMEAWNRIAEKHGITTIQKMTDKRWRQYKLRAKEGMTLEACEPFIAESEFIKSGNWFGFDWLVSNQENWLKLTEGKYSGKVSEPEAKW